MATYRTSRNLEASIIDFIETKLTEGSWSGVSVTKVYERAYTITLPVIVVRVEDTLHEKVEVGNNNTWRRPTVTIDIFATDDGNRLDLKDFLIDELKHGMTFYNYTTVKSGRNTSVNTKTANGRITVLEIEDTLVNNETNKSELAVADRYRHLLTLQCMLSKVED